MNDVKKSKAELLNELAELRQRVATLESVTTEQEQEIKTLRESEARYKLLFNNNNIGIIHFDTNGRYVLLNEFIASQLGGVPDDFIGKSFFDVLPEVSDFLRAQFSKVIHEGASFEFEDIFVLATGTYWHSTFLQPVLDHTNDVIGVEVISIDITKRKQMEEQLRYQSTLIEMISDAIISTDMNFVVQTWNPAAEQLYGWTAQEAIGKPLRDLVRPEYPTSDRDEIITTFMAEGQYSEELIHHRKDGTPIQLWGSVTLIYDDKGVPTGAVAVNRDITQRKQTEDALRESQQNMAEAQRIAYLGSWDLNVVTNDIYWSDEMYRIYGVEKGKVAENDIVRKLIHPDDLNLFSIAIDSALAGDVPEYVEYRIIRPDGQTRLLRATAHIFCDESGQVIRMVGTTQDITDRRQVEESLVESNQRFAQIAEAIEHVFWLIDVSDPDDYKVLYVNSAFERIWNHTVEELYSDVSIFSNYLHEDDKQRVYEAFTNFVAGKGEFDLEFRLTPPGKSMLTLAVTANLIRNKQGDIVRIAGITRDITKQKDLELLALENERLKTQFQKEQEQNELVQRIISTLSHDMRTPLSLITLSRDMLAKYYERLDPDRRIEMLDTITNQAEFAVKLLEDTVQVARGQTVFNPQPINVATLCQVSIDEVYMSKQDHHHLVFENVDNVETVSIDATLVSRILLNLLSNAIKYSPNGGEIKLELCSYQDGIILRVADEGMGISEEEIFHIFDLLYRSDNVNEIQGTGLGLNIVKDCVERHHGEITVESEFGKGSVFTVRLPA